MNAKFGTKRTCMSCGERFFDMGKNPFTCPKCGKEMSVEDIWKVRGVAAKAKKKELEDIVLDTGILSEEETLGGDDMDILEDTSDLNGSGEVIRVYDDETEDEEN
jgi:uncharacterized protein (TIGR02300 family)